MLFFWLSLLLLCDGKPIDFGGRFDVQIYIVLSSLGWRLVFISAIHSRLHRLFMF
jgi:hypothetical protein